jgi:restriction system protein
MALWMVRAGRYGKHEDFVLEQSVVAVGWSILPDLAEAKSRDAILSLLQEAYPDKKPGTLRNWRNQLWVLRGRIEAGDLVALPLKTRSAVAIGRVTGPYQYRAKFPDGATHTRPVEWLQTDIPRSAFGQDLLYSLGAAQTVCQIRRNDAEKRVKAMLEGKPDPLIQPDVGEEDTDESVIPVDLEAFSRDLIRSFIGRKFSGREMERLVTALLQAQGYQAQIGPMGADGGVDIVAGRGSMGFESPRLCVQVKSSDTPQDVTVLRQLQGVMRSCGADQGLLVSWSGFKSSVIKEARRLFFDIRLWDADNLVDAILDDYHQLPEDLQAELPLKRIWTLVLEEE